MGNRVPCRVRDLTLLASNKLPCNCSQMLSEDRHSGSETKDFIPLGKSCGLTSVFICAGSPHSPNPAGVLKEPVMTPGRAGDCVTGEEPWAWGVPFAQGERSPHLLRPLAANTTLSSGLVSDAGPCPRRVLPERGGALRARGSPVPTTPPSFVQDILSNASNHLLRACAEPEVKIQQ